MPLFYSIFLFLHVGVTPRMKIDFGYHQNHSQSSRKKKQKKILMYLLVSQAVILTCKKSDYRKEIFFLLQYEHQFYRFVIPKERHQ